MPRLCDVVSASPPHQIDQPAAAAFARDMFHSHPHLERLMPLFENTGIETRRICRPPEWYREEHGAAEKNQIYIEAATELCAQAARILLERRGLDPGAIDHVLFVNTTGVATPSIDARLINVLGLGHNVRRTPIWGLGCGGGAAGLSHAFHHLIGHPRQRVLLFAAEMCSLTFLRGDITTSNLVATALFADGGAVALLSGDDTGDAGFDLVDTRSTLYPDSLAVMGWNVVTHGLQVVFDRRIPAIVDAHAAGELDGFLGAHSLGRGDVVEFLYHPGGRKVVEAYATAYGVGVEAFGWSREVLREFGNMSSVTVLYVLERYLAAHRPGRGGHAVISALGPGFSSESLLMRL